jgi:hypothetical protein
VARRQRSSFAKRVPGFDECCRRHTLNRAVHLDSLSRWVTRSLQFGPLACRGLRDCCPLHFHHPTTSTLASVAIGLRPWLRFVGNVRRYRRSTLFLTSCHMPNKHLVSGAGKSLTITAQQMTPAHIAPRDLQKRSLNIPAIHQYYIHAGCCWLWPGLESAKSQCRC